MFYMKKIYLLLCVILPLFGACQQGDLMEEEIAQTRAISEDNTFTFTDAYIVWNTETYMLDYAIIAVNNPPLDAPITISYRAYASNGDTKLYSYVIPAGSTGFWDEGTTWGEGIENDMGLQNSTHRIIGIEVYRYNYLGNMELVGLDNLSKTTFWGDND